MSFRSRRRNAEIADAAGSLFDPLEPRLALYSDPFLANLPTLDMMEHQLNTVVRIQTSEGFIDIELYDIKGPGDGSPAPITTENFLNYVRTGRYEGTFFHRYATTGAGTPFVLQGGGFRLIDPLPTETPRFEAIPTDDQIQNEFHADRSNIERTLAMAKLADQPNSATAQFFFNLSDNSENLDNQNGGFTVFARVIQGWEVVTEITTFQVRNLNSFLGGNAFNEVPLSGPENTDVVSIIDIEVIKPKNSTEFYMHVAYYPEGFRSGRSSDTIELVNPDPNAGLVYQIIARFEVGQRDRVVAQGFLFAGAHLSLPMYRGGDPSLNLIRGGTPVGYEIRSSKVVGASLTHTDFNATTSESFVNPAPYSATNLQNWDFPSGQKGAGLGSFLTWLNLSDQENTVTATFYAANGSTFSISKTLQPYRRGGLNVNQLISVPDGLYSVRITSTQPIVAVQSQYRIAPARGAVDNGVIGGGSTQGVLVAASIPSSGQSILTAVYTGAASATAIIDLDFVLNDGTVLTTPAAITLSATDRRRAVDLSTLNAGLPSGQFFTVRYRVRNNAAPVSLSYTSIDGGDTVTTSFQVATTDTVYFGGGFTDPATAGSETLSIFNPFSDSNVVFTYRVRFHFTQGGLDEIVSLPAATLGAGQRVDLKIRDLVEVMQRIGEGGTDRRYSISVESVATRNDDPITSAVFAQLTRFDQDGGTIAMGPTNNGGTATFLGDESFS